MVYVVRSSIIVGWRFFFRNWSKGSALASYSIDVKVGFVSEEAVSKMGADRPARLQIFESLLTLRLLLSDEKIGFACFERRTRLFLG